MPLWTHFLLTYSKEYSFHAPFSSSEMAPVLVLHSSGSTGRPKPIILCNGALANLDRPILPPTGRLMGGYASHDSLPEGSKTYNPTPPYHFSGFMSFCVHPLYRKTCPVLSPITKGPMTPRMVKQLVQKQDVKILSASPSMIEGIYQLPGGKDILEELEFISYTGGPLAIAVGESLKGKVHLAAGCKRCFCRSILFREGY